MTETQIFGQGLIGNAPVDDRQAGAGALNLAEQIRPDFGFRNHYQSGLQRAEDAAHDEDVVHGREEDSIGDAAEFLVGGGASGQRRGGNEEARIGKLGAQSPGEFQAGQNFAHGNCMQPDCAGTNLSKRVGEKSEPLRQGAPVSAVPKAAKDEIQ